MIYCIKKLAFEYKRKKKKKRRNGETPKYRKHLLGCTYLRKQLGKLVTKMTEKLNNTENENKEYCYGIC